MIERVIITTLGAGAVAAAVIGAVRWLALAGTDKQTGDDRRPDRRDAAPSVQARKANERNDSMSYPHFSTECDEHHGLVRDFGGARPPIVCLCGSTRFYDQFQQANYDLTMGGAIVLSVGFYPHAKAQHGHGEGVGHDSGEKVALDELHKRKIDLADEVLVVSDETGYFGQSTADEIAYAVEHRKPVRFAVEAAYKRALDDGLIALGASA